MKLSCQLKPNPDKDSVHTLKVKALIKAYRTDDLDNSQPKNYIFFSPGQVQRATLQRKPRKIPGEDKTTNATLRHLLPKTIAYMTRLFNGIMRRGHFPSPWKRRRVIMLPKKGKYPTTKELPIPITLLSCVSKLYEKLINHTCCT